MSQGKRKKLVILLASLVLSLVLLEGLSRAFLPETPLHPPEKSDKLLSPSKESTTNIRTIKTAEGRLRNITIRYYSYGFKRWGDTETNRTKVLILGDSYTAMNYVSNGEEW